jgi:two-component system chemotaxis response regulator CheB
MELHPMPVIIVSSLTRKGGEMAMEAMDAGAVDVVSKPGAAYSVGDLGIELVDKIKAAAKVKVTKIIPETHTKKIEKKNYISETTKKVIAIGASTGGVQAIQAVLTKLPKTTPGILIVQHMPEHFTTSFAARMNEICEVEVREAKDGDHLMNGLVLIAPGNYHMTLERSGAVYIVRINQGPLVSRHRPSVDVLFESVANFAGKNSLGVILTGMGADGASGIKKMKETGAITIAQDEKSSIVFGMPKVAIEFGGIDHIVSLEQIAKKISELI